MYSVNLYLSFSVPDMDMSELNLKKMFAAMALIQNMKAEKE